MVGVMVLKTLLIPLAIVFLVSLVVGNYPVKRGSEPGAKGSDPAGCGRGEPADEPCKAGKQPVSYYRPEIEVLC